MVLGEVIAGFSGFKGRMLLTAGLIVLAGMAWNGASGFFRSGGVPINDRQGTRADWANGPTTVDKVVLKGDKVSGSMIGIGLSFMVAMIAASMLRAAFKTGITLLVLSAIALWFLDSRGYVNLWDEYLATAKEGGNWLTGHVGASLAFLKSNVPSTTAALIGFGFGLRR